MNLVFLQVNPTEMQGWLDLLNGRNFATVFFVFTMYVVWKHGSQITAFLKATTTTAEATSEFIKASTANNESTKEQMTQMNDSIMGLVGTSQKSQSNHDITHSGIDELKLVAIEGLEASRKVVMKIKETHPQLAAEIMPHVETAERILQRSSFALSPDHRATSQNSRL